MTIHYIPPFPCARGRNLRLARSKLLRNIRRALDTFRHRIHRLFGRERFDTVVMYISAFSFVFLVLSLLPRGPLHSSRSDVRAHWTIRLFCDGFASCTFHVYPCRRQAHFFANGGRWERGSRQLNIRHRCRVL